MSAAAGQQLYSIGPVQLNSIAAQVQSLILSSNSYIQTTADTPTVTLETAWKIFQVGLTGIISIVEALAEGGVGVEKKKVALDAARKFYVAVIAPLDLPWVPNMVEPMVDAVLEKVFIALAGGAIDAIVASMNALGVFKK